jgi:polyisoprenoid-binding protein YceI
VKSRHAGIVFAAVVLLSNTFPTPASSQVGNPRSRYQVQPADSWVLAITDKTGLLSFAAHQHAVLAARWSTTLTVDPESPQKSKATVALPVASLVIDSKEARQRAALGPGPSADDIRTIQERLLGPEVLDQMTYPEIRFTTTAIEKLGQDRLEVTGKFQLHGNTRTVTIPVHCERSGNSGFILEGKFSIRQTDFGIKPEGVAGGTVRVKDEVSIRFRVRVEPEG